MVLVDVALANWWQHQATASPEEKMVLLYQLLKEAARWLRKKQPLPGQQAKDSKRYLMRQTAVQNLITEVKNQMAVVDPNVASALQQFETTKAAGGMVGNMWVRPTGLTSKAMADGYAREREHYEQSGKAAHPISGTRMHGVWSKYEDGNLRNPKPELAAIVTQAGTFDQLSLQQYEALAQGLGPKTNAQVIYLNKVRRLKYLAVPGELDGLLYDINDVPINHTGSADVTIGSRRVPRYTTAPYAMDRYGNLFLSEGLPKEGEVSQYNHSSFNAGREVLCAGMLHIGGKTPGKLQFIDNASGHYQPTLDNLFNCLGVLQQQGVDLDGTCVRTHTGDVYTAANFLQTRGRGKPDWDEDKADHTFLW
jgi:hypothetical protein